MAELLPGIHQVEGIDPAGTHVYLLKDKGPTWTLIDTGIPGTEAAVETYLKKQGVALSAIRQILITHLHLDHTGGLKHLAERTKAKTFAHWIEAAYIAQKPRYDGPGTPPKEPFVVDEVLKDGDELQAGGGLQVYHTPGHTPGHSAYYQAERKVLFCGDLFFGTPHLTLTTPNYTLHTPTAQISARRMAQLSVDSLMTHHGGPFLKGGGAAIRAVVEKF